MYGKGFSQSTLSVAHLMYNFRKKSGKSTSLQWRHQKHRETPIPTYIGLKLHATVKSKTLIDTLFHLQISITHKRVIEISNIIAVLLLKKYEEEKVFFPSTMKKELFTIIAKDNVDTNALSTLIKQHYHGISMTIMQFPSDTNTGVTQRLLYDFR